VAATLWRGTAGLDMDQAQRAVDQLGRLRLVAVTGSGITLHDAVRDALREGLGETELARVHGLFLGAAAEDPLQPESPGTPTDAGFVITPGPSPAALVDALRVIAPALAGLPVMIPSPVGQDDPVFQMSSAALGDDFVVKFAWALSTARSTSTARYDRTTLTRQQRRRSAAPRAVIRDFRLVCPMAAQVTVSGPGRIFMQRRYVRRTSGFAADRASAPA
jgi:hypothetical protein